MINLFDMSARRNEERQERYFQGQREGLAEGRDIGRTETRNDVRDAISSSGITDRITKARLQNYIDDATR